MSTEATLHRAYLRRRANSRLETVSDAGRPRAACEPGARWTRIAVRGDDKAKSLTISNVSTASGLVSAMFIGGVLRTEVDLSQLRPYGMEHACNWCQAGSLELDKPYVVCHISEHKNGLVGIGSRCNGNLASNADDLVEIFNPLIRISSLEYPTLDEYNQTIEALDINGDWEATLQPLEPSTIWNEGVLLLRELKMPCPLTFGGQVRLSTILRYDGLLFRYDPRIVMLDNTLDAPLNLSNLQTGELGVPSSMSCPAPKKTFMNAKSCVLTHGCSPHKAIPKKDLSPTIQLNHTTLRAMYLEGNIYAQAISELPLSGDEDPCSRVVRWRSLGGPCNGNESPLDDTTRALLVAAINGSADTNPIVKDVELSWEQQQHCSNAYVAGGAIVDVLGECWQITNADQLNVYDFTLWAMGHGGHPGNDEGTGFYPIKTFAHEGSVFIRFPSHHDLDRWRTAWDVKPWLLGRLGDTIRFESMPLTARSPAVAEALGLALAKDESTPLTEVCGSPGEGANDPTLDTRFWFGQMRWAGVGVYWQYDVLEPYRSHANCGSQIAYMIMQHAPDQLRQRVSWALAQLWVVAYSGTGSIILGDHTEAWMSMYDIYVRNAFGSYLDIMREVSFTQIMSVYLTYQDSRSYAQSSSHPDENYARELLQLFTIGLFMLNEDGTQRLDSDGVPIPTYSNDDIVTHAKMWTGFRGVPIRGNQELKRITASTRAS